MTTRAYAHTNATCRAGRSFWPRLTVRRLIIAVAVVAVLVAADLMRRRSRHYRRIAVIETSLEGIYRRGLSGPWSVPADPRQSAYHAALRGKYERAARAPWLPVGPDPPGPDGLVAHHPWRYAWPSWR